MTRDVQYHPLIRSIWQLALIILVAVTIALTSNHFRPAPLPLI